jgi:two-component system, response regulator / RNA-binding antiterminator
MGRTFGGYRRAETFQASDAPLLVVDTDLVIRDANLAYQSATSRTSDELVGVFLFEAFPDNPDDSQATGVANLSASFERVFRDARRDYMPLQRYDITSRDAPGAFARKFWMPVNNPLQTEAGHLIGAVHHVEDVTAVVEPVWDSGPPASSAGLNVDQRTWNSLVTALSREALANQQARATAEQLQHALTSRIVIEQAKGVIAEREGISVDEAFDRLRQYARRHNALLHDVARAAVEQRLSV